MGGILNAIDISSRGLSAQRAKMNVIAQNMANAETVETPEGGPYRRKQVIFKEDKQTESFSSILRTTDSRLTRTHNGHMPGIAVSGAREKIDLAAVDHEEVQDGKDKFKLVYDPTHPDADAEGYVKMPDVEIVTEMVDMMTASRAYEANTAVISTAKGMVEDALEI
jgi:flagellar basal-body rod protein FlgC